MTANDAVSKSIEIPPKYSEWRGIARIFFSRKISVVGLSLVILITIVAIFAPLLAPYDPYEIDLTNKLAQSSSQHWLGTDNLGRDTLSRLIYASRNSLMVGIGAVSISAVIGQLLGLLAAYNRGWIFNIIMRFIDTLMSLPMIVLALVISAVLGGGLTNVIIALGIGSIPLHCRMMCGVALSVKQNDYITALYAAGANPFRIMFQHIFKNSFPTLLVTMTMGLGSVILSESALSFLGVGILSPGAAWGSMINDGYRFLLTNPLLSIGPGIVLMLTVFGFNMMGDGLRDALDPKLRGTI